MLRNKQTGAGWKECTQGAVVQLPLVCLPRSCKGEGPVMERRGHRTGEEGAGSPGPGKVDAGLYSVINER